MALDPAVGLVVGRQTGVPGERLAAHRAHEALLVGVCPRVLQQPERLRERLAADRAGEGPLAGVGAQVAREVVRPREALAALAAQVAFRPVVDLGDEDETKKIIKS